MADIQITAVGKIIEGALENNLPKVISYAEHIAKYLDKNNDGIGSRIIRSKIDGSYKEKAKVVLDAEKHGKVHYLKTWTPFFKDIKSGNKQFEVRKNDRGFIVGDTLILEEFDPDRLTYTGDWVAKEIIYILDDTQFTREGFVVLGMKDIEF